MKSKFSIAGLIVLVIGLAVGVTMVQYKVSLGSRAAETNSLGFVITRSLIQPGEAYGVWVTANKMTNAMYSGNLEVLGRYCDNACTSWVNFQQVWKNFDGSLINVNGGIVQINVPSNFPSRVTYVKVRPYPNYSGLDWSNEVQLNVKNTLFLEDTRNYWVFWPSPKTFYGQNNAFCLPGQPTYPNCTPKTFTTTIEYEALLSNVCGIGPGRVMKFTKDSVYGYWNPAVPWYNDLWDGTPNWTGDLSKFDGRFTQNLRWYLNDWTKTSTWNDTYLTSPGFKVYGYQTNQILFSDRSAGVVNPFPNYALVPLYLGIGWSNGMNKALNSKQSGDMFDTMCGNGTGILNGTGIWSVKSDFLPLSTKRGIITALRVRYLEGDPTYLQGGNFLREDWWFIKNQGLVRIETKNFGANPLDGRQSCTSDPDCIQNEVMLSPHVTLTRSDY